MSYPEWPDKKGTRGKNRYLDKTRYFTIEDEIKQQQSTKGQFAPLGQKLIYLQKIMYDDNNEIELRIGYYVIGRKGKTKGKWVWGQFAPFIPATDFRALVDEATRRGWI